MLVLAQVNIGINSVAIAGLFYVALGLIQSVLAIVRNRFPNRVLFAYLAEVGLLGVIFFNFEQLSRNGLIFWLLYSLPILATIFLLMTKFWSNSSRDSFLSKLFDSFFMPNLLLLTGLVILFQGWRLSPILQAQTFWVLIVVIYLFFQPKQT